MTESSSPHGYGVTALDLSTGFARNVWPFTLETESIVRGFSWTYDGCYLYIVTGTLPKLEIAKVNLRGELIESLSQSISDEGPSAIYEDFSVSPTGEWIAYLEYSGQGGLYYYEFQDLLVAPMAGGLVEPLAFTTQSWALEPFWSPSGQFLAFSSDDAFGMRQLYISQPDGSERIQLTEFAETHQVDEIPVVQWSPDNESLAFITSQIDDEGAVNSAWSISSDGYALQKAQITDVRIRDIIGWTSDSRAYAVDADAPDPRVIWIDATSGNQIHEFAPWAQGIAYEFRTPAGGAETVAFVGAHIHLYDMTTGTIQQLGSSPFAPERLWITMFPVIRPGTYNFPGEALCK